VASNQSSGGLGLGGVVFVVFLVLKLLDKIDWSWWWVTSPLWIPFALIFVTLIVGFILKGIASLL
jgi:hypothetical protein